MPIRKKCSRNVFINKADSRLLQECKIRMLENAAEYDVSIIHVINNERFESVYPAVACARGGQGQGGGRWA